MFCSFTVIPRDFASSSRTHPGNAPEIVKGRGSYNLTIFHNIEIVTRTFRYISIRVKENCLIATLIVRLNLCKDIVEII